MVEDKVEMVEGGGVGPPLWGPFITGPKNRDPVDIECLLLLVPEANWGQTVRLIDSLQEAAGQQVRRPPEAEGGEEGGEEDELRGEMSPSHW